MGTSHGQVPRVSQVVLVIVTTSWSLRLDCGGVPSGRSIGSLTGWRSALDQGRGDQESAQGLAEVFRDRGRPALKSSNSGGLREYDTPKLEYESTYELSWKFPKPQEPQFLSSDIMFMTSVSMY